MCKCWTAVHAAAAGGVSTVCFDATGQHCLTAGADGTIVFHTVQNPQQAGLALPEQAAALGALPDVDAMDEDAEPTQVSSRVCAIVLTTNVHVSAACTACSGRVDSAA